MAGKCKYCGFVGTQDEMVDHAGEMCQGDCQPDAMVKNFTDNQQTKGEICPDCGCVAISIGNNNFLCGCEPDR